MLTYQTNRNDVDGERSTKALKGHGGFTKKNTEEKRKEMQMKIHFTELCYPFSRIVRCVNSFPESCNLFSRIVK